MSSRFLLFFIFSDYNCSSGERNGRHYDEDIIIERDNAPRKAPARRRSPSIGARSTRGYATRDEEDIAEETEYYNRRVSERAFLGEGYNGAVKDWAIVDVPPGTKRVHMEGIGGASQEVTWQRYNGVRRSKFIADEEIYNGEAEEPRGLDRGRRFVAQKPKTETMWTEITKDLVVKDAIEGMGYDYEETEFFYYVMEYLRYVSRLLVPPFFVHKSLPMLQQRFGIPILPLSPQASTNILPGRCTPPSRDL